MTHRGAGKEINGYMKMVILKTDVVVILASLASGTHIHANLLTKSILGDLWSCIGHVNTRYMKIYGGLEVL